MAKGGKIAPYWRHFPGVGIGCPDKNEEPNNHKSTINKADRQQILAEFKKRFLRILDIGIHEENIQDESFENRSFTEIAYKLKAHCNDKIIYFDDCLLDVIRLSKSSWVVIESLSKAKINNIFSTNQSLNWNVENAEYNQMLEIATNKQLQMSCAKEACKYVFTPGKEDILKELTAYALLQYYSLNFDVNPKLFSTWLISTIVSLLSIIPWNRIMSKLIHNEKILCKPITKFNVENEQDLTVIKEYLVKASKKTKPKGFSKRHF